MPLLTKGRSFLRYLFSSTRVEQDLDQEIQSHLELLIEENIRSGMPLKEAQRAARIELGGAEQVKEQVRAARIGERQFPIVRFPGLRCTMEFTVPQRWPVFVPPSLFLTQRLSISS